MPPLLNLYSIFYNHNYLTCFLSLPRLLQKSQTSCHAYSVVLSICLLHILSLLSMPSSTQFYEALGAIQFCSAMPICLSLGVGLASSCLYLDVVNLLYMLCFYCIIPRRHYTLLPCTAHLLCQGWRYTLLLYNAHLLCQGWRCTLLPCNAHLLCQGWRYTLLPCKAYLLCQGWRYTLLPCNAHLFYAKGGTIHFCPAMPIYYAKDGTIHFCPAMPIYYAKGGDVHFCPAMPIAQLQYYDRVVMYTFALQCPLPNCYDRVVMYTFVLQCPSIMPGCGVGVDLADEGELLPLSCVHPGSLSCYLRRIWNR